MKLIAIFSLPHHLLSQIPDFFFFLLLIRLEIWAECSGFTAQFVFPKVRYVFPLATCLHLEFLPGRENNKIKFKWHFETRFPFADFSTGGHLLKVHWFTMNTHFVPSYPLFYRLCVNKISHKKTEDSADINQAQHRGTEQNSTGTDPEHKINRD